MFDKIYRAQLAEAMARAKAFAEMVETSDQNLRVLRAQQNIFRYEPAIRHLPFCTGDARNYCSCETEQSQNGDRIDVDHRLWLRVRAASKWNALHKMAWFFFGLLGGLVLGLIHGVSL